MKITFEGTITEIIVQLLETLECMGVPAEAHGVVAPKPPAPVDALASQGKPATQKEPAGFRPDPVADFISNPAPHAVGDPEDLPVETPVDTPVEKPVEKPGKSPEHMAKMRAARKPRGANKPKPSKTTEELLAQVAAEDAAEAEHVASLDPAEIVQIRQKTIEDLQTAYADGHQKEVFELLSRFGNGAKSFRELPADAFLPIRRAIDNGALT